MKVSLLAIVGALLAHLSGCSTFMAGPAAATAAVTDDPRTTGTIVKETAIKAAAKRFFASDPDLNERCHINLASFNFRVLMTGECRTEGMRQRAVDFVRQLAEVRHVDNEIQIKHVSSLVDRANDSLLTGRVKAKLLSITNVRSTQVKVTTEAGVVYLLGLIDQPTGTAVAEVIASMGGVRKVVMLFDYVAIDPAIG